MIELPNTKEIINVLLSYGEHIDMILTDYHHIVYCRRIIAAYYVTDGIKETYKQISIYVRDDNITVQIDNDIMSYRNFKKRYCK